MNEMKLLLKKAFPSESGLIPGILGRRFRLSDESEIYVVMGLKCGENRIVLQSESTEEISYMSIADFLKSAKRIEK